MKCPHCGWDVNDAQDSCPACGTSLRASSKEETPEGAKRANRIVAVVAAIACLVLFAAAAFAVGGGGGGGGRLGGATSGAAGASSSSSSSSSASSSAAVVPASSGGDTIVLSEDLVVYEPGVSAFDIVACDDDSITVTSDKDLFEGAIVNAGITDATPHGLLRKVVSIEPQGSRYRVSTKPAALTDAIEKCDVRAVVEVGQDGNYHIREQGAGFSDPFVEPAYAIDYEQNFDMINERGSFGPAEAFLYDAIEVKLKIEFGHAEAEVVNHLSAGLTVDAQDSVSVEDVPLFSKSLKDIHLQIGIFHLVFMNDLDVTANAHAQVSLLTMFHTAVLDRSIGFRYETGKGVQAVDVDESRKPSTIFSSESSGELFSMSGGAGVTTTLGTRLYGLAGFDADVGLQAEAQAQLQKIPASVSDAGALTLPGLGWKAAGSWSMKVWAPIGGSFVAENPFNVFDGGDPLVDKELFDTGDAIVLYEDGGSFGMPAQDTAAQQQSSSSSQDQQAAGNAGNAGAGNAGNAGASSSGTAGGSGAIPGLDMQAVKALDGWWEGTDHHNTMGYQPAYAHIQDGVITWYHYDPVGEGVDFVNTVKIVGSDRFSENGAQGWRFFPETSADGSWAYYLADDKTNELPIYKLAFGYGVIDTQGDNIFAVERYGLHRVGDPGQPEPAYPDFFAKVLEQAGGAAV